MFPLVTDFHFEEPSDLPKDPYSQLKLLLEGFPKTVVQNGDQKGKTLSKAVRYYGRSVLGKNGAETGVFKNGAEDIIPLIKEDELLESEAMIYPFGIVGNLVSSDEFSADLLSLDGKVGLCEKDSFMLIFATLGEFTVSHFGGTFRIRPGNMVFVPADFRIEMIGTGKLIIAHT